jgi:predicted nucleotidyltransferase
MKIGAIICEYNPLHSGHGYHIQKTLEFSDKLICIMSGSFVQRGESAMFDKWTRALAALEAGADMVIELPTISACAAAEHFSFGAVSIAHALGSVDFLSFGCEHTDITGLTNTAEFLINEPDAYKQELKTALNQGLSYPSARARAVSKFDPRRAEYLKTPNSILAVEYISALKKLNSSITPIAIKRERNANCEDTSPYPSAFAIRKAYEKDRAQAEKFISPRFLNCSPVFERDIFSPLMYKLRSMSIQDIADTEDVFEGLEHLIFRSAKQATSYEELLALIKSKRYTLSRIKRILINCLLGIDKNAAPLLRNSSRYARVLGVREKSKKLLSLFSKTSSIPIITSPAGFSSKSLALDIYATDIRALLEQKPAGQDYTNRLIVF